MPFKSTGQITEDYKKTHPRSTGGGADLSNHIVFTTPAKKKSAARRQTIIYIGALLLPQLAVMKGDNIDFLLDIENSEGMLCRVGPDASGAKLSKPSGNKTGRLMARFQVYPGVPVAQYVHRLSGEDIQINNQEFIFDVPSNLFTLAPEEPTDAE